MLANKRIKLRNSFFTEKYNIGLVYNDRDELINLLQDEVKTRRHTNNMLKCRMEFSFDYHIPRLIEFFHTAIQSKMK